MISRYQLDELNKYLTEEAKYKRWSLIEKEVLYSLENLLNLNFSDIHQLDKKIIEIHLLKDEVEKEEKKTKHDFVAFLNVLTTKLSISPISKYLHYGLTSSDVIDTSNSLLLREINKKLIQWITELQDILSQISIRYINTPQVGRTHGRHAEPVSFGWKFAITYQELEGSLEQLYLARRFIEVVTIKGATGSYAHISSEIQEELANRLRLFSVLTTTQALPRNRYSNYLSILSQIGRIINSLAVNLRTLCREEISELTLNRDEDSVGSSSMPQKINPVSLENIAGLTRWISGLSNLSYENIELWDERDISHSSNERMSLIDAPILLGNIVKKMSSFLKEMKVNEQKIQENLNLSKGLIYSQLALLSLLKEPHIRSRQEGRKIINSLNDMVRKGEVDSLENAVIQSNYSKAEMISILREARNNNYFLRHVERPINQLFKGKKNPNCLERKCLNNYEIDNAVYFLSQRLNWYYSDSNLQTEKITVILLIEENSFFVGKLISHLNFPITLIPLCLSDTNAMSIKTKLTQNASRILIVSEKLNNISFLENLYKKLSNLDSIKEVKSASLFLNISDKSIYETEYYGESLFSPNFEGKLEERKLINFNFKNWNTNSQNQEILVNWYGILEK